MSREQKVARAMTYVNRNRAIIDEIAKLRREYTHNHSCAKNLFIKAQVEQREIPEGYGRCTYGDTDW